MSEITLDSDIEVLKLKELAISSAHDGIALLDAEGKYYYLNDAHVKPFGYDHENELIGKTWHAIYPPEEIERLERDMFPLLVEHGKWTGETRGITKQGTPVYQEISLTFLKDGGIVCITRIINREKEYERELQVKARKMLSVVDNITDGILLEDEKRMIQAANPALMSMFGIPGDASNMIGVDCSKAILGVAELVKDPEAFLLRVNELMEGRQNGTDTIYLVSGRTLQREFIPILLNDSSEGYLWVYHDVTKLEESKRRLEDLVMKEQGINEVKSKLIHTISHEFKQPLNNAIDSLNILRSMTDNDSESYSRPWEYLSMELQRLNRNVNRIVNFESLYETRKVELTHTPAKNLISNFLNYNYKMFVMTGKFKMEDETGDETVGVDMALLDLALRNLVDNAIKYSNPNEEIHIRCFASDEMANCVLRNVIKDGITS
jgi:PAS domain S-box-containing protein